MATKFCGITAEEFARLAAQDARLGALVQVSSVTQGISFRLVRSVIGNDWDVWGQLGRGTSILTSTQQLDQYVYSYGLMVQQQWTELARDLKPPKEAVRLIDHGCGQGIAGLVLADKLGSGFGAALKKIVLVEPSAGALVRAEAIYRIIAPAAEIVCVCKTFDEMQPDDFGAVADLDTLHLFSNVIDVPGYDQFRLFSHALSEGSHRVVAVSHDRDFDGGTQRLIALKSALEHPDHRSMLSVKESEIQRFACGSKPMISWTAKLEVGGG